MRRGFLSFCLILVCFLGACSPAQPANKMEVITHPDGPLYVGDQVSFEVLTPAAPEIQGGSVQITFQGKDLGNAAFAPFGIGKRSEATLWWAWDTHGLKPGPYTLTFTRLPDNFSWNETFSLRPESQVPPPEPGAHWASITSVCCTIHYITGSAAERDIASLSQVADQESAVVAKQLGTKLDAPIDLIFMSRVVGQGGFTAGSVYVSYLDGNYMSSNMAILFHHEFVHYYDATLGGTYRPTIFVEGLAVYLAGGHYKPEPLPARAAALLDLGRYIPLNTLADDFYNQQHEIGYLEAATLVKYMVDTYGWEAFNAFYRDIPAPKNQSDSSVIDAALRSHFNVSFADLETAYLASLRAQLFTDSQRTDLRLTLEYFNTVRRYQAAFDPSAYFLTAWLPDGAAMRQRNIVADYLRHPGGWENRLVEAMLNRAHAELFSGDYTDTERTLLWTDWILDRLIP
ncbi:MAG: hypothetical protein WCE68_12170 [Anaerolineales bacterium]